jgi:carbon dioxide concentrating mechanism protein CcmM
MNSPGAQEYSGVSGRITKPDARGVSDENNRPNAKEFLRSSRSSLLSLDPWTRCDPSFCGVYGALYFLAEIPAFVVQGRVVDISAGGPDLDGTSEILKQQFFRKRFLHLATGVAAASATLGCTSKQDSAWRECSPDQAAGRGAPASQGGLTRAEAGRSVYGDNTFVSPLAEVYVGQGVFIAGNTVLRAAPNLRLDLGNQTNVQDNCVIRSLEDSSAISDKTSLAHHAIVRDSEVGDFVFIGFNAEIRNSRIGNGAFINHGARVENVELAENAYVDVGETITTQEQADALPEAEYDTEEFRREVLDANAEFAEGYVQLYDEQGYDSLVDVGSQPVTSFNPDPITPQIGRDVVLGEFARVVGDVRIGSGSSVGQRAAIRADEGAPIIIGSGSDIRNRVTFHALRGTQIQVGDALFAGDDAVILGPWRWAAVCRWGTAR